MPTATTHAATTLPAREGQNNQPPADKAQVSGPVAPVSPAKKSKPVPLSPIEAALKAVQDARTAHQNTGSSLAQKEVELRKIEREMQYDAGLKVIHATLLKADRDSRQNTLSAFLDAVEGKDKQVILDYLEALDSAPTEAKEVEKGEAETAAAAASATRKDDGGTTGPPQNE